MSIEDYIERKADLRFLWWNGLLSDGVYIRLTAKLGRDFLAR